MKRIVALLLALTSTGPLVAQTPDDFLTVVKRDFAHWDTNHDGTLSIKELDALVVDPKTTASDAAAAAALKRGSRILKDALPPLTIESIASMTAAKHPDLNKMFGEGVQRIAKVTDRRLFAAGLPSIETIRQGKLGNCFCLAPLGALVNRDPAEAAKIFAAQTDGTYQIRLGKKTVSVAPPTDAEIAIGAGNESGGIWVNLYEKAVGVARNEDQPEEKRVDVPFDAERGGSAGTMLAYITGHDITRFSFKFAKEAKTSKDDFAAKLVDLRQQLAEATKQNRLMTCGTLKPTTPGLTPNHAYAVLGYDAASDSVRLWNPHGQNFQPKGEPGPETGYVTTNGIFQIKLEQFVRQFSGMAFEVVGPTPASAGKS
jgi:hypothetical protein